MTLPSLKLYKLHQIININFALQMETFPLMLNSSLHEHQSVQIPTR